MDVETLLALPKTSNAFSALRSTVSVDRDIDAGSASSYPRKTPRLDADSDSGSASRSRDRIAITGKAADRTGPVRIQVIGFNASNDEKKYNNLFALLRSATRSILTRGESAPATYETLYTACCTTVGPAGRGESLYTAVRQELEQGIGRIANSLINERREGVEWVSSFVEWCDWFKTQVTLLQSIFTYLDRVYVIKSAKLGLREMAFDMFKNRIWDDVRLMEKMRVSIRQWLNWERTNHKPHDQREQFISLVTHLVSHNQYHDLFETYYIKCTQDYFADESKRKVDEEKISAQAFIAHCAERKMEEEQRADAVLLEYTKPSVVSATHHALLQGRLAWLAKDVVGLFMDEKRSNKLRMTYQLFAHVDGLPKLCAEYKRYLQNKVKSIVTDTARDDDMVERLLDLKAFSDSTLRSSFAPDASVPESASAPTQDFSYAAIDAFAQGFKARHNKPAELIAKHLDRLMRKGQRGMSDTEFSDMLDAALGLYRFTDDKDVFRAFYHRALAKRLLLERSASDDFEKAMLKKLKERYDPEFDMGDQMFQDLIISRDTLRDFHDRHLKSDSTGQRLSVMVLQRSAWPFTSRKHDVDLPPNMQAELATYHRYYKSKHQNRRLDWDHALGTATLKARFRAGSKDLSVSLYQAVILLLFNDEEELGFKTIKEQIRLDDNELRRTLQSLACGNKKVLKKRPVGRDVDDDDVFYFNAEFTDPRPRVHINSIQAKETAEESKRTQSNIEGDRKHYIDAAIVRIMKAKKELHFEQLKTQTIDAVKSHFVPEVRVIKQRIDGLVEQEYLRRDEDDMNRLFYVA